MIGDNLALYVAAYSDGDTAKQDFESLKAAEGDDFKIEAAVVMSRDADGKVDVLEQGDEDTASGAVIGGGIGFVVGLFAPPLLAATAIGAGIGAALGHLTKRHEEKELGVELDQYFPPDSSAVVVIVDNKYLDRVEGPSPAPTRRSTRRSTPAMPTSSSRRSRIPRTTSPTLLTPEDPRPIGSSGSGETPVPGRWVARNERSLLWATLVLGSATLLLWTLPTATVVVLIAVVVAVVILAIHLLAEVGRKADVVTEAELDADTEADESEADDAVGVSSVLAPAGSRSKTS